MLFLLSNAFATWTVLGLDPATGEVGAAGATCGPMVWMVAGLSPGKGAVAAQYATNLAGRDRAVAMLDDGSTPAEIIDELSGSFGDEDLEIRQYGVVGFSGPSAGFTGSEVEKEQAEDGDAAFRAQGNTLRGSDVVTLAYEVESFFSTLKADRIERRRWATREEVYQELRNYIPGFYDQERLHSHNGYQSPDQAEQQYRQLARAA